MFTQLNQYRVVLEAAPEFQQNPESLNQHLCQFSYGRFGAAERIYPCRIAFGAAFHQPARSIPGSHDLIQSGAAGFARRRGKADRTAQQQDLKLPSSIVGSFQGTAAAFQNSLTNEPLLILAALVTVYIVLGCPLRKLHSSDHDSFDAAVGRRGRTLALLLFGQEMDVIALIGIILLIGIVKKNGIMMIDFALEAERKEGKAPVDAIFQACLLRFRPIMMTTMAALFAGLPLAFGGGTGAELRRPLGIAIVGGLIFSQILTLYTTPVIYLAFDRLARRFGRGNDRGRANDSGHPEAAA